jgi:hypothetical protein
MEGGAYEALMRIIAQVSSGLNENAPSLRRKGETKILAAVKSKPIDRLITLDY